jgi:hypothetical protein
LLIDQSGLGRVTQPNLTRTRDTETNLETGGMYT